MHILHLAMANLRAALVALSATNSSPLATGGGVGMPGLVVLVSNLNEKVCEGFHSCYLFVLVRLRVDSLLFLTTNFMLVHLMLTSASYIILL